MPGARQIALALTFATGISGLVYEVTWQKYLAILLGSHAEATSAVLGIFLAGLSLGYALFGAVTRRRIAAATAERPARLLLLYAAVEGAIGIYALAFPWIFDIARALSLGAPLQVGLGFAFDVLLTAVLIGPPAVLMGGTIPILTQALARDLDDATRIHARIYAVNTAGACLGALAASFVLVPRFGLVGTLAIMAAVNLAAAGIFAWLGLAEKEVTHATPPVPVGAPASERVGPTGRLAIVAGLVGFAMMILQTVAIRVSGLAFGASPFTFSMVVAVFVLCIALGSSCVSLLRRVPPMLLLGLHVGLLAVVALLHLEVDQSPYWAHLLRSQFGRAPEDFNAFFLAGCGALLITLGPAVLLSGASLPLLFHRARHGADDLGSTAGSLYAWNTVGSLAGALLGGYGLLLWLDLDQVYRVAVAALAAAACLLAYDLATERSARALRPAIAVIAALGVITCVFLPAWNPELLYSGLFRYRTRQAQPDDDALTTARSVRPGAVLVFHEDDPTASVTVNEWRGPPAGDETEEVVVRSILTNGKPDGTTSGQDWATMALAALVPALLADNSERAFVIGWGTGITVGELARLPEVREVVVAEISSAVMNAAPLFDFANGNASTHEKVEVVRSDAYRALLRAPGEFDIIVSEPSNPWMTGVEMLYSREFLEAARDRLAKGGVYAQWYHQYETDRESVDLVIRTYTSVFEHVAVWYGGGPDLLLLGFENPDLQVDLNRLIQRVSSPEIRSALVRSGVDGVAELLAHELMPPGILNAVARAESTPSGEAPIHTLTHPRLSHHAARAFFSGSHVPLPFTGYGEGAKNGATRSLLQQLLLRAQPEERRRMLAAAASEACERRAAQCGAFLGALTRIAPKLAKNLADRSQQRQLFGGRVLPQILPDLATLLTPSEGAVDLETASRRTDLYQGFYQHGMPFRPRLLLDTWRRCQNPSDPWACRRGQRLAEELIATGRMEGEYAHRPPGG